MNMQANIEEALAFIPSDLPRDEWLKVATAIKSSIGEGGLFLFDSWSKTSEKYNSKAVRAVWKSARVNSRVTAGTIFYFAKQHGYQFKKMSHAERKAFNLEVRTMKRKAEEREFLEAAETRKIQQQVAIKAKHICEYTSAVDNDATYLKGKHTLVNTWAPTNVLSNKVQT